MIAVTFALRSESSEFLRRLNRRKRLSARIVIGALAGNDVYVLHTGVGEKTARPRVAEFLRARSPRLLISSGFAGGLTDELHPGELMLAENFSALNLAAGTRSALRSYPLHTGQLSTAAAVVHSAGDRAARTAAEGAIAVDMETDFIAEACADRSIPMLSLRVISDTPRAPFPAPPELLFDIERQSTRYPSLLLHIAGNPRAIPRFLAFGRQVAAARRVLADALCCLFASDAFAASEP